MVKFDIYLLLFVRFANSVSVNPVDNGVMNNSPTELFIAPQSLATKWLWINNNKACILQWVVFRQGIVNLGY
jgi:hypothetical protein